MDISNEIRACVMHFGEMGSRWGFNRTVGQVFALTLLSENPICAEDIMETLSLSRGNVSMAIKELQSWQIVKITKIPGDRKDYYGPTGDIWSTALKVLEERRKRELEPTLSLLRDTLLASDAQQDQFATAKLTEMHDLLELLSQWSRDLQGLSPETLKRLMKLGAGVSQLLFSK